MVGANASNRSKGAGQLMMTGLLIALVAGIASATMFASIASGAVISLLLFYMAPLPLMVAALGWGSTTALVGGALAGIGLAAVFSLSYMAAFTLTVALPAWWLGHLALLARPMSNDPQLASLVSTETAPALDWYPTGRILLWIVFFACLTTSAALLTLGSDEASITAELRRGLMRVVGGRTGTTSADTDRLVDVLAAIAPAAATIIAMTTLTMNLWLAAKITTTSGRMKRPWPDLRMTTMPKLALVALVVSLLLSFVGSLIGLLAQIVSSGMMMAYALTGFATLHTLTQAMSGRTFVLSAAYVGTLFIGWPILGMVSLGIADAVFEFRQTYWTKRGPPAPKS